MEKDLESLSNEELRELQTNVDLILMLRLKDRYHAFKLQQNRKRMNQSLGLRLAETVSTHYGSIATYALDTHHLLSHVRANGQGVGVLHFADRFLQVSARHFMDDFGSIPPWLRFGEPSTVKNNEG